MTGESDLERRKRLDLKRMAVLVIDETRHGANVVTGMCRGFGIGSIIVSETTESGLAHLSGSKTDLVICDWGTPPLDGLAFVRSVRASESHKIKRLPVILMKAQPTPSDVLAAREAGGTEFLARPFAAQALFDHLATIFAKPRDFVSAQGFVGPDRRRRASSDCPSERRDTNRGKFLV
jgi:two-component system chemotaxis response regulator CheY